MKIIAYGYKIPELTDKDFWDQYNFDITRLSTHNHDGNNSAKLRTGSIEPYVVELTMVDWLPLGTGYYYSMVFPSAWMMTWTRNPPSACPVQVCVRDWEGQVLYLDQQQYQTGTAVLEYGISFYTPIAVNCIIALY
jgi:hypothetical protein